MKKTQNFQKRLDELQGRFQAKRPLVVQAIFGEDGEFGSVTFERRGDQTRVLELNEPEPLPEEGEEPA